MFIKLLSAALLFISGTKVVVAVDHKMFPKQQVLRMKKPDWVVCLNMSHFTFCSQVSLSARSAFESFCFQFYSDDLSPEVKAWTQKKQTIENILPDTKIFASFYPPNPTHHHKSIQIRRVHCKYLLQRVCQLSVVGSGAVEQMLM